MSEDERRDWDRELAKIDKLIAAGESEPPPLKRAPGAPEAPDARGLGRPARASGAPGAAVPGRHTPFFTWVRLVLALGIGIGMTQWPYVHGCGVPLFFYLLGVLTVIVASFWTLLSSWKSRSGLAHFLSVALLFWGGALLAREVLPRVGYARQTASWLCPQTPGPVSPR